MVAPASLAGPAPVLENTSDPEPASVWRTVHQIDGRMRLRLAPDCLDKGLGARAAAYLTRQRGVQQARWNRESASLIVHYDPASLSGREILGLLRKGVPEDQRTARLTIPVPSLGPLVCGGLALALGLLGAPLALTAGLCAIAAAPIVTRAVQSAIAERRLSVDALDATAVTVLVLRGNLVTASLSAALIAGGEYIRALTARRSHGALIGLLATTAAHAWVVRGRLRERVPAELVAPGDTVVVYPGELVLVDGVVIRGQAMVDQKVLTGESRPVLKVPGDPVFASTVLTEGRLYVRTERVGDETRAQRIVQILEGAPAHDTRIANYARQIGDRFVLPTLALAGLVYGATRSVERAVSVLVFDIATGIRVSVPTAVLASMNAGVRRDLLIKGGRALEQLARTDTLVFDKTGTLTSGTPHVQTVRSLVADQSDDCVLRLAAAVEQRLRHPAAEAIVRAATARGLAIPEREDRRFTVGAGVQAVVEGGVVLIGDRRYIAQAGVEVPPAVHRLVEEAGLRGASSSLVAYEGRLVGLITYTDTPRPEARAVLRALRDRGVRNLVMVTGDNAPAARWVAAEVGIDRVEADVFPEDKAAIVRQLQAEGHVVGVIGDGINDSPALAYADVSFSLKAGTDVARETADIVLHGDLYGLVESVDLARQAMGVIRQNLAIVAAPNAAGIGLAAAGLIGPAMATALNNGSAVAAGLNGLRPLVGSRRRLEGTAV